MWHHQFESMGTLWQITIDHAQVDQSLKKEIFEQTDTFDQQFSRFIKDSQANAFRNSSAGTYRISDEFAKLLTFAQQLKAQTKGAFDPAVGTLLEAAGYDAEYCFRSDQQKIEDWKTPQWQIKGSQLTIDGPIVFDIGGYGKGYWIDQLAQLLTTNGYHHFLVDGGGDMFATSKTNGQGWKVAIEKPGDTQTAIATVTLKNQGLAISDVFKRQWGDWHHTVDPELKQPTSKIIGCSVVAASTMVADGLSTCLSLISPEQALQLTKKYTASFIALSTKEIFHSADASEIFTIF